MSAFLSSLLRNRRGMACVACCCLIFGVTMIFGTWAVVCLRTGTVVELPPNVLHSIYALAALKAWTYRDDRKASDGPKRVD